MSGRESGTMKGSGVNTYTLRKRKPMMIMRMRMVPMPKATPTPMDLDDSALSSASSALLRSEFSISLTWVSSRQRGMVPLL